MLSVVQKRNITVNLHDIGFGNGFLAIIPKAQARKEKFDKLNFTEVKNSYVSKDIIKTVKRPSTEWRKKIANHLTRTE